MALDILDNDGKSIDLVGLAILEHPAFCEILTPLNHCGTVTGILADVVPGRTRLGDTGLPLGDFPFLTDFAILGDLLFFGGPVHVANFAVNFGITDMWFSVQ